MQLWYIFTSCLTMRSTDLLACLCKPNKYIILEDDCVGYAKGLIIKLLESSGSLALLTRSWRWACRCLSLDTAPCCLPGRSPPW